MWITSRKSHVLVKVKLNNIVASPKKKGSRITCSSQSSWIHLRNVNSLRCYTYCVVYAFRIGFSCSTMTTRSPDLNEEDREIEMKIIPVNTPSHHGLWLVMPYEAHNSNELHVIPNGTWHRVSVQKTKDRSIEKSSESAEPCRVAPKHKQ